MINYVTGGLGAGKSLYSARKIGRGLLEGRVVATNMRLVDGWQELVLRHSPYYRLSGRVTRREYVIEVSSRYAYVPDIPTLLRARIHGRGEGRGIMLMDEAHNEINNREWEGQEQKEALRKLTLGRKRGWHTHIISQHKDNTDAAARRIASTETKLTNWRQFLKLPLLGTNLLPFPIFVAETFPVNQNGGVVSSGKRLRRELFTLGWWKGIYDTFEDFDGQLGPDPDALWLPLDRAPLELLTDSAGAGGGVPSLVPAELVEADPSDSIGTVS